MRKNVWKKKCLEQAKFYFLANDNKNSSRKFRGFALNQLKKFGKTAFDSFRGFGLH